MELKYVVACDFGQTFDYSTVAVIERRLLEVGEPFEVVRNSRMSNAQTRELRQKLEARYRVVRLDRVPLRTSYKKVVRGIVTIILELYRRQREEHPKGLPYIAHPNDKVQPVFIGLAADEGGVGKSVCEQLLGELRERVPKDRPKVKFFPVTGHGGVKTTSDGFFVHAPKRDIIAAGQICYQNETLKVGDLRWRAQLEHELANYRLKVNTNTAYVGFEPHRAGDHDDLLFAVCLGCWTWTRPFKRAEDQVLARYEIQNRMSRLNGRL